MLLTPTLPSQMHRLGLALILPAVLVIMTAVAIPWQSAKGQTQTGGNSGPLTLRADTQEADSKTGVLTARGNVQIYYPARQIQATAAQAQYFSREHRIVLSGNVYILQHGNSIRGETVTYLIDSGQFIAMPKTGQQVESVYIVTNQNNSSTQSSTAPATPPLSPKPAAKQPPSTLSPQK